MTDTLTLSQHHIETFLTCKRRFQLRYLERLPWPLVPMSEADELAQERGSEFHRVVERHFLDLPAAPEDIEDQVVRGWIDLFHAHTPRLPQGRRYVETSLTVPIGRHFLTGRFDLLVVDDSGPRPAAHVYDWKTSAPRPVEKLRLAWQTRLYLALLAEGGSGLLGGGRFAPADLSFTYWFLSEPEQPRTIHYTQADHNRTWGELQAIVADIDARLASGDWPLTENLDHCRRCSYQAYNGRQDAGAPEPVEIDEDDDLFGETTFAGPIEPEWA